MSIKDDLKKQLDNLIATRKTLSDEIDANQKQQYELCDLINRSAIFDETILFNIAQLISYKEEKKPYLLFTFLKHAFLSGNLIEELYVGMAPDQNIVNFIRSKSDNFDSFLRSKQGYVIFQKDSRMAMQDNKDKIVNFYNYYDGEDNRKKIVFTFLLDDYKIKNAYSPIHYPVSLCNFDDFLYVQEYIRYLFELQIRNNGKQLTNDEMHKALNDFLALEKGNSKVFTSQNK